MRNFFILLVIQVFCFSCNSINTVKDEKTQLSSKASDIANDYFRKLLTLDANCLNFSNLYSSIEKSEPYQDTVSRKDVRWIFDLEVNDSIQFEKADIIKPLCKLFENDKILSIVFTDMYDYKQALHVFNFNKVNFKPVSSFILYSNGGDAEDFWKKEPDSLGALTFRITEEDGYLNDIESSDIICINSRTVYTVTIDRQTGKVTKEVERVQKNITEVK